MNICERRHMEGNGCITSCSGKWREKKCVLTGGIYVDRFHYTIGWACMVEKAGGHIIDGNVKSL
jgi:hypothetical protein